MIKASLCLRSCIGLFVALSGAYAAAPTPTIVSKTYEAANQITVAVQSTETGKGYLTLLAVGATAGNSAETRAGQVAGSQPAFRSGSMPLTASTQASYTFRNLTADTNYTVCFTAEDAAEVLSPDVRTVSAKTAVAANLTGIDWTLVGSSVSAGNAWGLSIAIAPDGMPWVACYDGDSSRQTGVVKRFDGQSWTMMGADGPISDRVSSTSIKFGADGLPYIAYTDGNARSPRVARLLNGEWRVVGAVLSASSASSLSLAFAPDGAPYLAFCDGPASSAVARVMKFDGVQWVEVGNLGGLAGPGVAYVSLAFAPNGAPWVAFSDPGASGSVTVMRFDGTAWITEGVQGFSSGSAPCVSLAFSPAGTPYVVYSDELHGYGPTVMKRDTGMPSGWSTVGPRSFSDSTARDTTIAFGPDGAPCVAYHGMGGTHPGATVMRYDAGSDQWTALGRGGFSSGEAYDIWLAIGPDGAPFVVFRDATNGYKATVCGLIANRAPTDLTLSASSVVQTPGSNVAVGSLATTDAYDTGPHTYALVSGSGDADNAWFNILGTTLRANNPAAMAGRNYTVRVRTTDSGGLTFEKAFTVAVLIPPRLSPIVLRDVGANQATLVLQSNATGRGYFTLVPETSVSTGTGAQVVAGQGSDGSPAFRFGSLPLSADTDGIYTVRNLFANTTYTVRFTADDGTTVQPVPVLASFTTRVATNLSSVEWVKVGSAGVFPDRVSTSLAFASDGTPYVAFEEYLTASNVSRSRLSRFDGTAWVVVGNPAAPYFSSGNARSTTLAIAPDGNVWTAFWDGSRTGKISVMALSNGTWDVVGSAGFSAGGEISAPSLAFAPDGTPYVAFCEVMGASTSRAVVMRLRSGTWESVGDVAGAYYSWDDYTSLAFGPDGVPYVAYMGGNGGGTKVKKLDEGAPGGWREVGAGGFTSTNNGHTSLAFAPDGTAYVTFYDYDHGGKATVKKLQGGAWVPVGSPGFSENQAYYPSLAFGADGTPHIAYLDYLNSPYTVRPVVMRFDGVRWVDVATLVASSDSGWRLSFAVAPDGSPYLGFPDSVTYGTTMMRLIDTTAPRVSSVTRQNPTTLITDADTLVFRVTFSEAVQNVSADDFVIGGTTATVTAVTSAGGNAYDVTVSGGDLPNLLGTVTLSFTAGQDIRSTAGSRALSYTVPTGANNNTYDVAQNTVPTFVGSVTTLTVAQNSAATNIRPLLAVSDTDTGQTLTWSQSSAPAHGTLAFVNATRASGGTNLTSGGTITYTPANRYAGPDSFVIAVTDGKAVATRTISVTVTAPTIALSPTGLSSATVGVTFSQTITASGGTSPHTYAITSGALPAGLTLSSAGALSGKPTAGGVFIFTVSATDNSTGTGPFTASRAYTLTVNPPTLSISPGAASLPVPVLGIAYNQTLTASGGTAPHSYAITSGALPAGLSLSSTGALTGTPSASGAFSFEVTATDSSTGTGPFTVRQTYSGTVSAPTITLSSLTAATVAAPYSRTITASGGTGPYTYAVTSGALPAGLNLSSGGMLSGTPTAGGTFDFTVTATDSSTVLGPFTGTRAYTLTVNAPTITVSPSPLPAARVGMPYSQPLTAANGTAPYTFDVSAGTLPPGLSLSSAGVLSGTPTAGGTFTFTIRATDSSTGSGPYTGTRAYRTTGWPSNAFTVNTATIVVNPTSLPDCVAGASYSSTITASGGTPDYTFAVSAGSLPTGLSLSGSGELTGTPTVSGLFNFTIKATDSSAGSGPYTASRAYTLGIAPAVNSIARVNANPSNAASVSFAVTFSGSVSGVDAGDFVLATSGVTGAAITGVTGSGNSYSVSVNTGGGDGTLRLDVSDDDSIRGANSMPLGGAGMGNGAFTTGQIYTIDKTPPTATVETVVFSADTGRSATDLITATATQTISGTVSAPLAAGEVVQVSLDDGGSWANATIAAGSRAWSLVAQTLVASNTIRGRVADAAGNLGAVFGRPYVLDLTPPAAPPVPSTALVVTTNPRPAITGIAEPGSSVELHDGATLIGTATADAGTGTWSITPSTDLGIGIHSLSAAATDVAGNTSGASSALSLRIESADPGSSLSSQTITFGPLADRTTAGERFVLSATANSGLAVKFTVVSGPATISGDIVTLTGLPGVVIIRATQSGDSEYEEASPVERSFKVNAAAPLPIRAPANGAEAILSARCTAPGCTYQWQYNGVRLNGATGPTFTLSHCQPSSGGLYTYTVTTADGTRSTSEPVIVGLSTNEKLVGTGLQAGADIRHPNGNIYDQLLLEGAGASFTADAGQVTRMSFVDLSDDIVQVEFSGAGTLSLVMDNAPAGAPAANYNQPGVNYVRGNVGIVITGANETSNVSVFSVGRANAVNQSLFRDDVAYDGVANVAFIAIQSTNGRFGGVYTGNVEYFASQGFTGLYAPGVAFAGPVNIGDIQAYDNAQPVLVVGSASNVRIAGGTLAQPNGRPIQVAGVTTVTMAPGQTSQGNPLPAQPNRGVLQQHGLDVTDLVVAGP